MSEKHVLPGFKVICTSVACLYILLGASTLLQGPGAVLAPFGVPSEVLASAHFQDFFHWVFVHMIVLGLLIGLLGRLIDDADKQRLVARVLCLVELQYAYLDLRTSVWGNGLYADAKSLVPVLIDLLVVGCFMFLSVRPLPLGVAAQERVSARASGH